MSDDLLRIDYFLNPRGVLRSYNIPYGVGMQLEGRVVGIIEDGFSSPNWFEYRVVYPNGQEIGGAEYQKRRGFPDIEQADAALHEWCKAWPLPIFPKN